MPKGPVVDLTIGPPPTPEIEPGADELFVDDGYIDTGLENAPHVDESLVRTMLRSVAGVASHTIGRDDVENHWRFTDQELDDLTPPLTRVINKRPALRAAVARGDEAAIGIVLASYTGRNMATGRSARIKEEKAKREQLQRETDESARANTAAGIGTDHQGNPYGRNGGRVPGTDSGPVVQ